MNLKGSAFLKCIGATGNDADESFLHAMQIMHVQVEQSIIFDNHIAEMAVMADLARKAHLVEACLRRHLVPIQHGTRIHDDLRSII